MYYSHEKTLQLLNLINTNLHSLTPEIVYQPGNLIATCKSALLLNVQWDGQWIDYLQRLFIQWDLQYISHGSIYVGEML